LKGKRDGETITGVPHRGDRKCGSQKKVRVNLEKGWPAVGQVGKHAGVGKERGSGKDWHSEGGHRTGMDKVKNSVRTAEGTESQGRDTGKGEETGKDSKDGIS